MKSNKHQSGKYAVWMWLSWAIFAVTTIASAIMIKQSGVMGMPTGLGSSGMSAAAFTTVAICIGQTVAALLVAGAFTVANGIYEAVIENRPD